MIDDPTTPRIPVRRAGVSDVGTLIELRGVMLAAMGETVEDDTGWRDRCATYFATMLERPDRFVAYLVDATDPAVPPPGGPDCRDGVACAVGAIDEHAPSPANPSGHVGYVFNVATVPMARRRGCARATVTAVLDWFDARGTVPTVRLAATEAGEHLYRSLGFDAPTSPILQRRAPHRESRARA